MKDIKSPFKLDDIRSIFFYNYIKKIILIDNFFDMKRSCFDSFKKLSNIDFNIFDKINYIYNEENYRIYIVNKELNINIEIGYLEISSTDYFLNIPKAFIKKTYYNTLSSSYEKKATSNIILNYKFINNLPSFIIKENEKEMLEFFNNDIKIKNIDLTIKPEHLLIINRKTKESKIYNKIVLSGGEGKGHYYLDDLFKIGFRKSINSAISKKYTNKIFGKDFKSLNKDELKLLEINNY